MTPVFRFAPSPNGRLHLGHALSALLNERFAQAWGGRLLLRIEDIDLQRCRPEYEAAIREDLAWLGLRWEEPVRRQSEHFDDYRAALRRLPAPVYPCFCTRRALALRADPTMRDPDGTPLYPGTCRRLAPGEAEQRVARGEPHAWRLDMAAATRLAGPLAWTCFSRDGAERPIQATPERWGDAVLLRKDVPASYHLAVTVDDALQGVTHVVRGQDLEAATDIHALLQRLLGLPSPRYHHHALVHAPDGEKLAKSRGAPSLASLRAAGATPGDIRRRLGFPERSVVG